MSKQKRFKADLPEDVFDDPADYRREDNRKVNHNHREDRREKLERRFPGKDDLHG